MLPGNITYTLITGSTSETDHDENMHADKYLLLFFWQDLFNTIQKCYLFAIKFAKAAFQNSESHSKPYSLSL